MASTFSMIWGKIADGPSPAHAGQDFSGRKPLRCTSSRPVSRRDADGIDPACMRPDHAAIGQGSRVRYRETLGPVEVGDFMCRAALRQENKKGVLRYTHLGAKNSHTKHRGRGRETILIVRASVRDESSHEWARHAARVLNFSVQLTFKKRSYYQPKGTPATSSLESNFEREFAWGSCWGDGEIFGTASNSPRTDADVSGASISS